MRCRYLPFLASAVIFFACSERNSESHLFENIPPSASGFSFTNVVENTDELNIFNYRNFYNGGGAAIGDINNDGWADIFMTGNTSENKLFLNKGNFKFEDITSSSLPPRKGQWSTGVVMVDINSDGWLDIYVCNAGYLSGDTQENELYINNGDLTFTEQAATYGLNNNGYTTHAAFFDYDFDGDLDAYILNNSFIPVNTLNLSDRRDLPASEWPVRDFLKKGGDQFLVNENGYFTDKTLEAGIYTSLIGFGLGITVGDVNGDRWPDLYVSNDFYERDYLYINRGDGTFQEDIINRASHISLSSMGADMADLNNDGHPEIFVTDMLPDDDYRLRSTSSFETYSLFSIKQLKGFHNQYMQNTLQLNNGDGSFREIGHFAGVSASDWSWGALLFDMDLDGMRDIYVCNGIRHDVTDQDFIDFFADEIIQKMALTGKKEEFQKVLEKMPSVPVVNKIFRNKGDMRFDDVSSTWCSPVPSFSNGAAYGDLDDDGDLDLVVNNVNQEAFLLKNSADQNTTHHYIGIRLSSATKNTFAIGSLIRVHAGGKIYTAEIMPSRGFQSSVDYKTIIGLGEISTVDSIEVFWPRSMRSLVTSPQIDAIINIHDSTAVNLPLHTLIPKEEPLFAELPNSFIKHQEDDFIDFYAEGLLAHKLSCEGPAYARGDINGDQINDIIIGGGVGQNTMIYLGQKNGWSLQDNTGLESESDFEDVVALFHDLDGDGDNDLFMGSGGNHDFPRSRTMQDRIYLNDGQGHFKLSAEALPPNGYNTSSAVADDIDRDGDPDLIVCSRSIPGNYGPPPPSYIYLNNGNATFRDGTDEIAPDFRFAGMLTDIELADIDGDKRSEWIVTREWGAPLVFRFKDDKYIRIETGLNEYKGWWLTVSTADLDEDGDIDLIFGNRGNNFYFSGQSKDDYKLWIKDFDNNGTVENIMTRSVNGRDVPVAMKKELTEQLPFLKKKNLRFSEYAQNSLQDLLPAEQLSKALVLNSSYHSSVIAWNEGNGNFLVTPLPAEAQLTCVNAIAAHDINLDGKTDIVLGGNNYGWLPQFSRLDAGEGLVLLNVGDHKWNPLSRAVSGIYIPGEIKYIDMIDEGDSLLLLTIRNNDVPYLFSMTKRKIVE